MSSNGSSGHPLYRIIRETYLTPPIERLGNFFINAYQSQRHGMRLVAPTRFGKTRAIQYLRERLTWRPAPMVFSDVRLTSPERFTEAYFFSMLSSAFNIRQLHHSPSTNAVRRVANHLVTLANHAEAELVVLAIDEAQRLTTDDWRHVVTLDNELDALGKRIFLIFIEQTDATGNEAETIREIVPAQVYERYTKPKFNFPGVVGPLEISACLDQFDEEMIWPTGSGTSYSAYFAPEAFRGGWRLSKHAQQIYEVANALRAEQGLSTENWHWRMVSFDALITHLVLSLPARGPGFEGFSDEDVRNGLIASFFSD